MSGITKHGIPTTITGTTTFSVGSGNLVIDQGANDQSLLCFASSDVAHGVTGIEPTDVYAAFLKVSGSSGGLLVRGLTETTRGFQAIGYGGTVDTTKSSGGNGFIAIDGFQTSGITVTDSDANANIVIFGTRRSGGRETVAIIDTEGSLHTDAANATYDEYNDPQLCRALDLATAEGVVASQWDDYLQVNRQSLIDLKILSPEGFLNTTKLQRLHNGAIWQLAQRLERLERILFHPIQTLKGLLWKQ